MALIYRANRVVNFAQAELGTVPTSFAAAFIIFWGWPYLLGLRQPACVLSMSRAW